MAYPAKGSGARTDERARSPALGTQARRAKSSTRSLGCYHRRMKIPARLALALAMLPLTASADETFRCGQWIVSSDMSVEELSKKCGPPTYHETFTEDVLARSINGGMQKVGETVTDKWIYDRGTQAPPMVVTIVDGRIKSIDRQKK